MAQAARLNLRMQKELKLLLTDPPPGATFPSLSSIADASSSSAPSLTSIDAEIEGPQGTVYESGVFKLKIQIPERYPFQPPIVMFATPIYHPNIDNGGRICLDILNLPPKGAWQPSLNISTVLTSIGLLLSEPNPDDGLMEEASREYKYNRPAFDQKARSMTEKYARAGPVEKPMAGQESERRSQLNKDPAELMESTKSIEPVSDHPVRHKRLSGVSKKLSLEASEFDQKKDDMKVVQDNLDLPSKRKFKGLLLEESNPSLTEHNQAYKNSQCTKKKLQLGSRPVGNCSILIEGKPKQLTPPSEPLIVSEDSSKCWTMGKKNHFSPEQNLVESEDNLATSKCINIDENSNQVTGNDAERPSSASQPCLDSHTSGSCPEAVNTDKEIHARVSEDHGNGFTRIKHKKLGLAGRRLPSKKFGSNQCLRSNDKENLVPKPSALLPPQLKESSDSDCMLSGKSDEGIRYDESKLEPINYPSSNATVTGQLKPLNSSGHSSKSQALKQSYERDRCNNEELHTKESDKKFAGSLKSEEQACLLSDSLVVLDSEDSEDEKEKTARSKLPLARRRLPGKRKA